VSRFSKASARARKAAAQSQRFVLFGDCAQGTPAQRAVAYQASLAHPDFLFITGDIVYGNGRISEYREKFFPVYNSDEAASATGAPLLRSVPFIAAPGNHDTALRDFDKFPDGLAYFLYWDQPLNGPGASPGQEGTSHPLNGSADVRSAFLDAAKPRYPNMANFSFDYGNAHWTVLDSNHYMDWSNPALREWVAKDLAAAKNATWRFVAFHHPGFNSSKEHLTDQWMRLLSPVFEEGKVDVVFAGHVHNYQRTFPLTFVPKPDADGHAVGPKGEVAGDWKLDRSFGDGQASNPRGVLYIISGGGGAELYNPEQQGNPSSWQPFTQKYIADRHSFSVVEIDGKHFNLRQISDTGEQVDAFQLKK
jgi:3',5'-cyclic AMP phosphodiesterase CpdA